MSGLPLGERVVTDGTDRLRDGAKVTIPADQPRGARQRRAACAGQRSRRTSAPASTAAQ